MDILYIIGNGLDIAHHMKTSYQDFFKYYLTLSSDDKDILAMKNDIYSHKFETWADLEMGMGAYSSQCADKGVFLKCLNDIKKNLREYLQQESEKISLYKLDSYTGLTNPGQFLDPEPKSRYDWYCDRIGGDQIIDVITFNYTSTLESLFGFKKASLKLSSLSELHHIQHVHGTLNNMMVMGVNDSSQISNTSFNMDLDVVEDFIKPEYNDACMNNKNADCESLIKRADMIVLYGTSLGRSDDKWWKLIGKRMVSDHYPLLVYLPYDENKDQSAEPNRLRRWTMEYVRKIQEKFDIQLDEQELASRICIAINKRLLPVSKVTKVVPHSSIVTRGIGPR